MGDPCMKYAMIIPALLAGTMAEAHVGHVGEVAGHGHWLGAAAIGAAIAIGLWAGLRGKSGKVDEAEAEEVADEELQEA